MNAPRRVALNRALFLLREAMEIVEVCAVEEVDALQAMPDSLQDSPRGQAVCDAAEALEDAESHLCDAIARLEDAVR